MTNEEALSILHCPDAYGGIYGEKYGQALEMAIKALEQESILDKIRAEIQENINYNKKMNYQGIVAGLLLALDIINKYKAESEVKDEDSD